MHVTALDAPDPGELRRCSRCLLPETYPQIAFDENDVCSVCRVHRPQHEELLGEEALRRLVDLHRSRSGKYDCLTALSGGRDSTYALYYAVRKLGLKTLAFTVDQGFIPAETWENIAQATRILGVEHVVIKHRLSQKSLAPMLRAWVKRPSASMVSFMCLGCRLGMRKVFLQVARQYALPLCISGAGEPEGSFATAFFSTHSSRLRRMLALFGGIGVELLRNPRYLLHPALPWRMVVEFLYEYPPAGFIRRLVSPRWEYVPLFRYIPYDENEIMRVLTEELKWQKYRYSAAAWRADCKISLLKNALYQQTLGFTKHDELISGLIRRGLISREAGLARLAHDNQIPEQFLDEFFAELGVRREHRGPAG